MLQDFIAGETMLVAQVRDHSTSLLKKCKIVWEKTGGDRGGGRKKGGRKRGEKGSWESCYSSLAVTSDWESYYSSLTAAGGQEGRIKR